MNLAETKENLRKAKATVSYWKTMVHEKETEDDDNGVHRFNDKDIIHEDARLKPYDLTVEQRDQCMKDLKMILVYNSSSDVDSDDLYYRVVDLEDKYHIESLYDVISYCAQIDNSIGSDLKRMFSDSSKYGGLPITALIKMWDGEIDD